MGAGYSVAYECQGKVHSLKQGAGVHPVLRYVRISIWSLKPVKRLAHTLNPLMKLRAAVRLGSDGADRADGEFKWTLHFRAIRIRRIELRRRKDCSQHLANVSVSLQECLRDAIDQCRRRLIGNKPAHEFRGDEFRRGRMMRKYVEHHQSVFLTAARRNLVTQYNFLAVVMNARPENERARFITNQFGHPRINYCLGS